MSAGTSEEQLHAYFTLGFKHWLLAISVGHSTGPGFLKEMRSALEILAAPTYVVALFDKVEAAHKAGNTQGVLQSLEPFAADVNIYCRSRGEFQAILYLTGFWASKNLVLSFSHQTDKLGMARIFRGFYATAGAPPELLGVFDQIAALSSKPSLTEADLDQLRELIATLNTWLG